MATMAEILIEKLSSDQIQTLLDILDDGNIIQLEEELCQLFTKKYPVMAQAYFGSLLDDILDDHG